MADLLAKNKITGEITYLDILNDDYTALTQDEINEYEVQKTNENQKSSLQSQLEELDKKCIRALREPSVKDESTGQTWLEFYNAQIQDLRAQLAALA